MLLVGCSSSTTDDEPVTTTTSTARSTTTPASPAAPVLDELWDRAPSESCLVVLDAGRVVFEGNPDLPLVPASTLKLLVAAAAPVDEDVPDLVTGMLRDSDNEAARSLLDRVGGPAAVVDALVARGLPVEGVVVADGTGHDRTNRVTCRLLTAILDDARPLLDGALAVAGETGTLATRFVGTPVAGRMRAKTGSIRGVSSLAGFVDGYDGRSRTFAFVTNGVDTDEGTRLQDELGRLLVGRRT